MDMSGTTLGGTIGTTGGSWSSKRSLPFLACVFILLSLLILGGFIIYVWPYTLDDSFITFRYAANLMGCHELTYTCGQPPSEGYTTFLWMILMCLPQALGLDPVLFAKCFGCLATLLYLLIAALFIYRVTDFLEPRLRAIAATVVLPYLAFFSPTAFHAVSGMETSLFTLLVTLYAYQLTFLNVRSRFSALVLVAFTGLLLSLTRPEGNLFVLVSMAVYAVSQPSGLRLRLLRASLCGYVAPGLAYFLWRLWYYKILLPLPAYVKNTDQTGIAGADMMLSFMIGVIVVVAIPLGFGLYKAGRRLLPVVLAVAAHLVMYTVQQHIMGLQWRYLFPVTPLIFVLTSIGIAGFLQLRQQAALARRQRRLLMLLLGLLFFAPPVKFGLDALVQLPSGRAYAESFDLCHRPLGEYLRACRGRQPLTLAVADAGAIPYYSQWNAIDTFGLSEIHIALTGDRSPAYILGLRPDLVILISRYADFFDPLPFWEQALYEGCISRGLRKVNTIMAGPAYYLWLMAKPGSAAADCAAGFSLN